MRFALMLFRPLCAVLSLFIVSTFSQSQSTSKPNPRVIVVGVNGMELDVIRPLLLKGDLPNLARVAKNGVHGK
jgi:predicted AlkP superfamily pyrophosphatase or phosphodiesterase